MTGEELYQYYTKKRDYTGSLDDVYAQELLTLFFNLFEEIFPLLEKAEEINKRLYIKEPFDDERPSDGYTIADVGFI